MQRSNSVITMAALLCAVGAMLAVGAPAWAAIVNPLDSSAFTYQYNGDTVPTTTGGLGNTGYGEGATLNVITNITLATDGNILETTPTDNATFFNSQTHIGDGSTWDTLVNDSTGHTWEVRMRQKTDAELPPAHVPGTLANLNRFDVVAGDGTNGDNLAIDKNGLAYPGSGGAHAVANQDGQFHTYRVAQAPNSQEVDFWFDGAHVATLPGGTSFKDHRWGHLNGWTSGWYVDYIRWEVGGYSPIPEPATASLLLLGAVALCGRRRR